jgi:hypothetical protein
VFTFGVLALMCCIRRLGLERVLGYSIKGRSERGRGGTPLLASRRVYGGLKSSETVGDGIGSVATTPTRTFSGEPLPLGPRRVSEVGQVIVGRVTDLLFLSRPCLFLVPAFSHSRFLAPASNAQHYHKLTSAYQGFAEDPPRNWQKQVFAQPNHLVHGDCSAHLFGKLLRKTPHSSSGPQARTYLL